MSVKQLFVASQVQIAMLQQVIIPEMNDGFWKDHRPAGHGAQWLDVELVLTTNNQVGPSGFKVPRLYNFTNPEFMEVAGEKLLAAAQSVDPSLNHKKMCRILHELSQIVGSRLMDLTVAPTKAFRGNNVPDERGDGNVLESGKSIGNGYWLESITSAITAAAEAGLQTKPYMTYVSFERGERKMRMFLNGAGHVVFECCGTGNIIAKAESVEGVADFINAIQLDALNVANTTTTAKNSPVTINGDTVVRRVPVVRAIPQVAYTAADPFAINS